MCLPLRRFPIMMNYGICIRCSDRVTVTTAMNDTEKEIDNDKEKEKEHGYDTDKGKENDH